jgi:thiol-disulfide isomerase/thioredoxin
MSIGTSRVAVHAGACALLLALAARGTPAAAPAAPAVVDGDAAAVLAAVKAPGARAVLVNMWATWCDACRDELPALERFYRENRGRGLRLVMVSVDDAEQRAEVAQVIAGFSPPPAAGTRDDGMLRAFIKKGDDTAFIDAIDRRWTGALPATFLFDDRGVERKFWPQPVTRDDLASKVDPLLRRKP